MEIPDTRSGSPAFPESSPRLETQFDMQLGFRYIGSVSVMFWAFLSGLLLLAGAHLSAEEHLRAALWRFLARRP